MHKVPFPAGPDKLPVLYAVTCVRLVCDVFLTVELVGVYPSAVAAALAMASHSVEAGVGVPAVIDSDHADASTTCRTPAGDRGDRHVYHLVAVPTSD